MVGSFIMGGGFFGVSVRFGGFRIQNSIAKAANLRLRQNLSPGRSGGVLGGAVNFCFKSFCEAKYNNYALSIKHSGCSPAKQSFAGFFLGFSTKIAFFDIYILFIMC